MAKPLDTFRVYDRKLYAVVNVWNDRQSMRDHVKAVSGGGEDCYGAFQGWKKVRVSDSGRVSVKREIGEININREDLEPEVVAHECAHAAISLATRRRLRLGDIQGVQAGSAHETEERLCHVIGRFVAQVSRRLNQLQLA